jgi:hypothetical protein
MTTISHTDLTTRTALHASACAMRESARTFITALTLALVVCLQALTGSRD